MMHKMSSAFNSILSRVGGEEVRGASGSPPSVNGCVYSMHHLNHNHISSNHHSNSPQKQHHHQQQQQSSNSSARHIEDGMISGLQGFVNYHHHNHNSHSSISSPSQPHQQQHQQHASVVSHLPSASASSSAMNVSNTSPCPSGVSQSNSAGVHVLVTGVGDSLTNNASNTPTSFTTSSLDGYLAGGQGGQSSNHSFDLLDSDSFSEMPNSLSPRMSPANNSGVTYGHNTDSSGHSVGLSAKKERLSSSDNERKGVATSGATNNDGNNSLTVDGKVKKKRKNGVQSKPICSECGKEFSNQSALSKHKLTHSDERKFACNQCAKAFKRQDHLQGHLLTHRSKKPYECDIDGCEKTYCDARSLRRHKENHHAAVNNSAIINLSSSALSSHPNANPSSSSVPTVAFISSLTQAMQLTVTHPQTLNPSLNRIQYAPPPNPNPIPSATSVSALQSMSANSSECLASISSSTASTGSTRIDLNSADALLTALSSTHPSAASQLQLLAKQQQQDSNNNEKWNQHGLSKYEGQTHGIHHIRDGMKNISQNSDIVNANVLDLKEFSRNSKQDVERIVNANANVDVNAQTNASTKTFIAPNMNSIASNANQNERSISRDTNAQEPNALLHQLLTQQHKERQNLKERQHQLEQLVQQQQQHAVHQVQQLQQHSQPNHIHGRHNHNESNQRNSIQHHVQQQESASSINLTDTNSWPYNMFSNANSRNEPQQVECQLCGRKFKNVPALNGHMRLHGGYLKNQQASGNNGSNASSNVTNNVNTIGDKRDKQDIKGDLTSTKVIADMLKEKIFRKHAINMNENVQQNSNNNNNKLGNSLTVIGGPRNATNLSLNQSSSSTSLPPPHLSPVTPVTPLNNNQQTSAFNYDFQQQQQHNHHYHNTHSHGHQNSQHNQAHQQLQHQENVGQYNRHEQEMIYANELSAIREQLQFRIPSQTAPRFQPPQPPVVIERQQHNFNQQQQHSHQHSQQQQIAMSRRRSDSGEMELDIDMDIGSNSEENNNPNNNGNSNFHNKATIFSDSQSESVNYSSSSGHNSSNNSNNNQVPPFTDLLRRRTLRTSSDPGREPLMTINTGYQPHSHHNQHHMSPSLQHQQPQSQHHLYPQQFNHHYSHSVPTTPTSLYQQSPHSLHNQTQSYPHSLPTTPTQNVNMINVGSSSVVQTGLSMIQSPSAHSVHSTHHGDQSMPSTPTDSAQHFTFQHAQHQQHDSCSPASHHNNLPSVQSHYSTSPNSLPPSISQYSPQPNSANNTQYSPSPNHISNSNSQTTQFNYPSVVQQQQQQQNYQQHDQLNQQVNVQHNVQDNNNYVQQQLEHSNAQQQQSVMFDVQSMGNHYDNNQGVQESSVIGVGVGETHFNFDNDDDGNLDSTQAYFEEGNDVDEVDVDEDDLRIISDQQIEQVAQLMPQMQTSVNVNINGPNIPVVSNSNNMSTQQVTHQLEQELFNNFANPFPSHFDPMIDSNNNNNNSGNFKSSNNHDNNNTSWSQTQSQPQTSSHSSQLIAHKGSNINSNKSNIICHNNNDSRINMSFPSKQLPTLTQVPIHAPQIVENHTTNVGSKSIGKNICSSSSAPTSSHSKSLSVPSLVYVNSIQYNNSSGKAIPASCNSTLQTQNTNMNMNMPTFQSHSQQQHQLHHKSSFNSPGIGKKIDNEMNEDVDDQVFLSPIGLAPSPKRTHSPSIPMHGVSSPKRLKNRPEPLYIPPHVNTCGYQSRLRSPRLWDPNAVCESKNMSPPPYTPPPMLSPVRSGSGLFWHIISGSMTPKSGQQSAQITPKFIYARKSSFEKERDSTESREIPAVISSKESCSSEHRSSTDTPTTAYEPFDCEYEFQIPETDIQPHVNIGPTYQARIPAYNSNQSQAHLRADKGDIVWDPLLVESIGLSDEDVESFLELSCSACVPGSGRNKEYALHLLCMSKGDIHAAIVKLLDSHPLISKDHPLFDYQYPENDIWVPEEIDSYHAALNKCDKDFFNISKEVGSKSTKQCIQFYYMWKKVCPEEYRRLRILRRKREQSIFHNLRSRDNEENVIPSIKEEETEEDVENNNNNNIEMAENNSNSNKNNVNGVVSDLDETTNNSFLDSTNPSPATSNGSSAPPVAPVVEYPCKLCGKTFLKIKSRSAHMKIHGSSGSARMT